MVNEEKLREILDMFEYEELLKLKDDLDDNVSFLREEIEKRVAEIHESESNICVTCGRVINLAKTEHFQLVFGRDTKKVASFCASDCLEYFVRKLRELDRKVERGVIKDREDLDNELINFDEYSEL